MALGCFLTMLLVFHSNQVKAQDIDTLTWEEIVEFADTVLNSGLDTLYIVDDTLNEMAGYKTGTSIECTAAGSAITVNLNKTIKTINKGQFGVNVTGMFTKSTLYGDIYSADQRQWLSDMMPKVLRFPGGSSSKFMHLLPYKDGPDAGTDFDPIKGYGYDIVEITRYLDAIDNVLEAPSDATSILAASDATALSWFGGDEDLKAAFDGYVDDYNYQEELAPGDMFIDQFIDLVNDIELFNSDATTSYQVNVIVCLNILTETASQCLDIVQYLQTNGVNVVGVELGNETANKFHRQIMRFEEFEDYWSYVDGDPVSGQAAKETLLGETLYIPATERNFFYVFRNRAGANYKIGVCADGFNEAGHVFRTDPNEDGGARSIDWNVALQSHYSENLPGTSAKKFHAVILHTYYSADSWYDECITTPGILNSYGCPQWDFTDADTRIQPAFDAVRSNFRNFMLTRYSADMNDFNTDLQFNLTSADKKDMWITEWNLKDEGTPNNGKLFTNSYMHTLLLQEWWMQNLKLNYTAGFRENFFKYSTLQNFAGGSGIALLTPAEKPLELTILGKNVYPYSDVTPDAEERNYYVKRTTEYTMELLSDINRNSLNYFPATVAIGGHNPNLAPTFFITPEKDFVYMYFTNSRCNDQRYILNPAGMYLLYGYTVELTNAEMFVVDALQGYSQSGKSMLYDFNSCYTPASPYDIEIDQTYNYINPGCAAAAGSLCVTVPGFTSGYVKMQVAPFVPKIGEEINTEITIYPNPSNTVINLSSTRAIESVEMVTLAGVSLFRDMNTTNAIEISQLPAGMYNIIITFTDGSKQIKSFVKS